ncbi:MAG: Gfo/Idh/MocA family oxidoreductase [Candidatus Hydrogenedentes bacterium]|nr:Gfo/Idh/MocA family oxidoreductase [Candidatus Hydrogenedentota bacterium]
MHKSSRKVTRRQILKGAAALTTAAALFPQIVPRHVVGGKGFKPPSETVNVASIGVGGWGGVDLRSSNAAGARIVALCDVDKGRAKSAVKQFQRAKLYKDFRRLLEKEKGIDAVTIGIPDHSHATVTMAAMELGKHVYCEKPLAHTMYEVRMITEAARRYGVATQLGCHGHSADTIHEFCECIWSGAIGKVREIHILEAGMNYSQLGALSRLANDHRVPQELDWDLWLGPAPERKYNPLYHPGAWRGWRQFGTGMLGDWLCHVVDPVFWALDLGAPSSVFAEAEGFDSESQIETFPQSSKIRFEFPERGELPPVTMTWYDGDKYAPPRPEELEDGEEFIPTTEWAGRGPIGALVVGDKGKITYGSHGAAYWRIIPESKMNGYKGDRTVKADPLDRSLPSNVSHHQEFLQACKGYKPAGANFDYGGPLTEIAMLGNIAHHMPGTKLEWDAKHMMFPSHPEANQYLHYAYRDGWTL